MTVAPTNSNIEITGSPKYGALKEWVQLRNVGSSPVELLGAKIRVPNVAKPITTAAKNIFTFATSTILAPGESVRIAGWAAPPALSFDTPNKLPLFYEQGKDVVELLAADGTSIETVNIDNLPPAPWVTSTLSPTGVGAHDFGSVQQGAGAKQVTFTIENGTGADLVLTGTPAVVLTGGAADFQIVSQPKSPVKGGDKATFVISFDPSKVGALTGTLSVAVAKLAQPVLVSLEGTGTAAAGTGTAKPVVELAGQAVGASVDWGSVPLSGNGVSKSFALVNRGNATLHVTKIALADTSAFACSPPTLPQDLAAGASLSFSVSFNPNAAGARSTSLTIESDAPSSPTSFSVSGTAQWQSGTLQVSEQGQVLSNDQFIDFGTVAMGSHTSRTFTVTNRGSYLVQLGHMGTSATDAFTMRGGNWPKLLAPGASATFVLECVPTRQGKEGLRATFFYGEPGITIHGDPNAPGIDDFSLQVRAQIGQGGSGGQAQSPQISLIDANRQTSIANGQTVTLNSQQQGWGWINLRFENRGAGACSMSNTAASDPGWSVQQSNREIVNGGSFQIPAGGTADLTVAYYPGQAHNTSVTISFQTNDPANPVFRFTINGWRLS